MKGDVFLDTAHLIQVAVMESWASTVCLLIFINSFFVHTISSYQLQFFYSDLIFSVVIVLCP